jgi:hypothetical protein
MKVYVLETGVYENRGVSGIFDAPKRAMAAAKGKWTRSTYTDGDGTQGVSWTNDLDWDGAASVSEWEVASEGPTRSVDQATVQVYVPLNGGWAYLPESPESLELARDAAVVMGVHRRRKVWREAKPTEIDTRIAAMASAAEKLGEAMG